jgi:hypothetical protein
MQLKSHPTERNKADHAEYDTHMAPETKAHGIQQFRKNVMYRPINAVFVREMSVLGHASTCLLALRQSPMSLITAKVCG